MSKRKHPATKEYTNLVSPRKSPMRSSTESITLSTLRFLLSTSSSFFSWLTCDFSLKIPSLGDPPRIRIHGPFEQAATRFLHRLAVFSQQNPADRKSSVFLVGKDHSVAPIYNLLEHLYTKASEYNIARVTCAWSIASVHTHNLIGAQIYALGQNFIQRYENIPI